MQIVSILCASEIPATVLIGELTLSLVSLRSLIFYRFRLVACLQLTTKCLIGIKLKRVACLLFEVLCGGTFVPACLCLGICLLSVTPKMDTC